MAPQNLQNIQKIVSFYRRHELGIIAAMIIISALCDYAGTVIFPKTSAFSFIYGLTGLVLYIGYCFCIALPAKHIKNKANLTDCLQFSAIAWIAYIIAATIVFGAILKLKPDTNGYATMFIGTIIYFYIVRKYLQRSLNA